MHNPFKPLLGGSDTPPPDLVAILDELSSPEISTDVKRRIMLYRNAIGKTQNDSYPLLEGLLRSELAYIFTNIAPGDHSGNLAKAIYNYRKALKRYVRGQLLEKMPNLKGLWALTNHNLAKAYFLCTYGNHSKNIENAIKHYNESLTIYVKGIFSEEWASVQSDLGITYLMRPSEDRIENLKLAIGFAENAYAFAESVSSSQRTS